MNLNKKLDKLEPRGEDKKINLRMAKGKADILEILAKHYGITVSTLIREMIDNSLIELQKELVVVEEGLGLTITQENNQKKEIRYLPSIIEILAPDIEYMSGINDFKTHEELDNYEIENGRLSVEYGLSFAITGTTTFSRKDYHFEQSNLKEKE
jgi:predicted DNA-binding protein